VISSHFKPFLIDVLFQVQRNSFQDFAFPKGNLKAGELPVTGGFREFDEAPEQRLALHCDP
jgi:hypothetical protein